MDSPSPQDIPRKLFILLHGRGSNATRFGLELLDSKTSSSSGGKTLQECFPSVKFIFPTAKKRRSTILKRVPINQWFDNYSLEDPTERQDLQYQGLCETAEFIGRLVREEAAALALAGGVRNVVVGGLSQGCAMALIVSLSFVWTTSSGSNSGDGGDGGGGSESPTEASPRATTQSAEAPHTPPTPPLPIDKSLGGFIGMSGWLPFAQGIIASAAEPALRSDTAECEDDPFESASAESTTHVAADNTNIASITLDHDSSYARQLRAANYVRDLVDLAPLRVQDDAVLCTAPYFLGHGTVDEKVSVTLGQESRDTLAQLGLDVTWKPYDGQGHWYKVPDELDDIASFLRDKVGIPYHGGS